MFPRVSGSMVAKFAKNIYAAVQIPALSHVAVRPLYFCCIFFATTVIIMSLVAAAAAAAAVALRRN